MAEIDHFSIEPDIGLLLGGVNAVAGNPDQDQKTPVWRKI